MFVVQRIIEGEHVAPKVMSASEIFDMMDMADCYDIQIVIWKFDDFGKEPKRCEFLGVWSNAKDPLRMVIVCENKVWVGYGTDH